jgi:hypothetical protein
MLAGIAPAQTTTAVGVNPFVCRNNPLTGPCSFYGQDGRYYLISPTYVDSELPDGTSYVRCQTPANPPLQLQDLYPQDTNSVLYASSFSCDDSTVQGVLLKGYRYYSRGGGGRGGGGSGYRYQITSGTISIQQ